MSIQPRPTREKFLEALFLLVIFFAVFFICIGVRNVGHSIDALTSAREKNSKSIDSLAMVNQQLSLKIDSVLVSANESKVQISRLTQKIKNLSYEIERAAIDSADASELQRMFSERYPE